MERKSLITYLVDYSSSMGDGFSPSSKSSPPNIVGNYKSKLEAAKKYLIDKIPLLPAGSLIQILIFNSQTQTMIPPVYLTEIHKYRNQIDDLKPNNGTDIAQALNYARLSYQSYNDYSTKRIIVVSDGLSERKAAEDSAAACINARIPIDVILIDDTDEGRETAEAICSVYGKVITVGSEEEIGYALDRATQHINRHVQKTEDLQAETANSDRRSYLGSAIVAAAMCLVILYLLTIRSNNADNKNTSISVSNIQCQEVGIALSPSANIQEIGITPSSSTNTQDSSLERFNVENSVLVLIGALLAGLLCAMGIYMLLQSGHVTKFIELSYETDQGTEAKIAPVSLRDEEKRKQLRLQGIVVIAIGITSILVIGILVITRANSISSDNSIQLSPTVPQGSQSGVTSTELVPSNTFCTPQATISPSAINNNHLSNLRLEGSSVFETTEER